MDAQILRYIKSSFVTYFAQVANNAGIPFYAEGQEINYEKEAKLIELRINGPRFRESTSVEQRIECEIDVMCSCKFDENDYSLEDVVGVIFAAAAGPINIYQYSNPATPNTDPPLVGCFLLRDDVDNSRDIRPWGPVNVAEGPLRINQTSVEAQYVMNL